MSIPSRVRYSRRRLSGTAGSATPEPDPGPSEPRDARKAAAIGDQLRLILPISGGRSSNLPKRLLLSSIVPMGSGHPSIVPTDGGRPSIVPTGWGRPSILPTGWGRPSIVPTDCHQGLAATAAGPAGGPSQGGPWVGRGDRPSTCAGQGIPGDASYILVLE